MFLGTHDAVAAAVAEGKADVGATFAYFDEVSEDEEPKLVSAGWGAADVRLVARAGPIPCDLIAARDERRVGALQPQRHAGLRPVLRTPVMRQPVHWIPCGPSWPWPWCWRL